MVRARLDRLFGPRTDCDEDAPIEADHHYAGNVERGERGPEDKGRVVEDAQAALPLLGSV